MADATPRDARDSDFADDIHDLLQRAHSGVAHGYPEFRAALPLLQRIEASLADGSEIAYAPSPYVQKINHSLRSACPQNDNLDRLLLAAADEIERLAALAARRTEARETAEIDYDALTATLVAKTHVTAQYRSLNKGDAKDIVRVVAPFLAASATRETAAQLAAVRALHARRTGRRSRENGIELNPPKEVAFCSECEFVEWPCPTIRAIDAASSGRETADEVRVTLSTAMAREWLTDLDAKAHDHMLMSHEVQLRFGIRAALRNAQGEVSA